MILRKIERKKEKKSYRDPWPVFLIHFAIWYFFVYTKSFTGMSVLAFLFIISLMLFNSTRPKRPRGEE